MTSIENFMPLFHYRGKPCPYCGDRMTKGLGSTGVTRDHKVVPRSKGGRLTAENRIIVCRQCNQDKGSCSLETWLARLKLAGDDVRAFRVAAIIEAEAK